VQATPAMAPQTMQRNMPMAEPSGQTSFARLLANLEFGEGYHG